MNIQILTDLSGYSEQIEELRQDWISDVLTLNGFEEDLLASNSQEDLFDFLIQSGVDINYYPSFGGSEIIIDGELLAEWGGPEFKVEFDSDNNPYYRITIEYWIKEEE